VLAAAESFNRDGYDGTDSNRIAREAGYSPGTFYKHFTDKRAVFLAVYEEWVAREWRDVSATIASEGSTVERAERVVQIFLEHHRKWRGFRASLRVLVTSDSDVRDFYRVQRRRQLDLLARMRADTGATGTPEADALLLFTLERTADAFAEGEPEALKLRPDVLRGMIVELVRSRLEAGAKRGRGAKG
jgi:AcrR family transcriptional regulator